MTNPKTCDFFLCGDITFCRHPLLLLSLFFTNLAPRPSPGDVILEWSFDRPKNLRFFLCGDITFCRHPLFLLSLFSLIWPLVPPPVTSFLSGHNIVRFVNYYCLNNTVMLRLCRLFPNLKLFQILLFRFYLRKFVNDLVIYPAKKKACKILN